MIAKKWICIILAAITISGLFFPFIKVQPDTYLVEHYNYADFVDDINRSELKQISYFSLLNIFSKYFSYSARNNHSLTDDETRPAFHCYIIVLLILILVVASLIFLLFNRPALTCFSSILASVFVFFGFSRCLSLLVFSPEVYMPGSGFWIVVIFSTSLFVASIFYSNAKKKESQ